MVGTGRFELRRLGCAELPSQAGLSRLRCAPTRVGVLRGRQFPGAATEHLS